MGQKMGRTKQTVRVNNEYLFALREKFEPILASGHCLPPIQQLPEDLAAFKNIIYNKPWMASLGIENVIALFNLWKTHRELQREWHQCSIKHETAETFLADDKKKRMDAAWSAFDVCEQNTYTHSRTLETAVTTQQALRIIYELIQHAEAQVSAEEAYASNEDSATEEETAAEEERQWSAAAEAFAAELQKESEVNGSKRLKRN